MECDAVLRALERLRAQTAPRRQCKQCVGPPPVQRKETSMPNWLLKGGWLVDPVNGRDGRFDILIENDRIAKVGPDLVARRVDARRPAAGRAGGVPGPDRHARPPA